MAADIANSSFLANPDQLSFVFHYRLISVLHTKNKTVTESNDHEEKR